MTQKIFLVAYPDDLAANLVIFLIKNNLRVVVVSEKTNLWKNTLRKLKLQTPVELQEPGEDIYSPEDTVLMVDTYFYTGDKKTLSQKRNIYTGLKSHFGKSRIYFLVSADNFTLSETKVFLSTLDVHFIFLSALYKSNPKTSYLLGTPFYETTQKMLKGKSTTLRFSETPVYPISTQTAASYVTSLLLHKVRPVSRVIALAEEALTMGNFLVKVAGKHNRLRITYDPKGFATGEGFAGYEDKVVYLGTAPLATKTTPVGNFATLKNKGGLINSFSLGLNLTLTSLKPLISWMKQKGKVVGELLPKRHVKQALATLLVVGLVFSVPVVSFLAGGVLLSKGKNTPASQLFAFSATSFNYYYKATNNNYFLSLATLSESLTGLSLDLNKFQTIADKGLVLGEVVLGVNTKMSFSDALVDFQKNYHYYYRDLQFLLNDLSSSALSPFIGNYLNSSDISYLSQSLQAFGKAVDDLGPVLGEKGKRTYLVMLQNNSELRPTGGFMGSFALLTFEKGILSEVKIHDVYEADGQLKGHIEPPTPISKYLGEANWFMRDANWDPDFATSAGRVMWFLQKELEIQVDGVVAIDASVIRSLVAALGGVNVSDYDKFVTADNFYEVVQFETEKDFFPGSTRKANFLSALTNEILQQATQKELPNPQKLGSLLLESVRNNHLQVYFDNVADQTAWQDLNWAWKFNRSNCPPGTVCTNVNQALVEANVGVNKASTYLKRNIKVDLFLDNNQLLGKTSILYENTAPLILGYKGTNKSYARLFVDNESQVKRVDSLFRGNEQILTSERETFDGYHSEGVLTEIPNSSNLLLNYQWQSVAALNFSAPGKLVFNLKKQYGFPDDTPVTFAINPPLTAGRRQYLINGSLTKGGPLVYNCTLNTDCSLVLEWK